jgi:predicted dehydrogenase
MRIGIVGNNLYGQSYARAARTLPDVEVAAICPELAETLEPYATQAGLRPYPDLPTMLAGEGLDAVLLACVTARHAVQGGLALDAGLHVLIDRPVAMTLAECDLLLARAEAARRVVMVGHVLQFWPEYMWVRKAVQHGELGQVRTATASRVSGTLNSDWQARLLRPDYGLGGLEAHVHDVDFLVQLLGRPQAVTAHGTRAPQGAWAQVHSLLSYADGCRVGLEADYGVPLNFPLSMYLRLVGDDGTVVYTFRGALAAQQAAERQLTLFRVGQAPEVVSVPLGDAFAGMLAHFVACAREGQPPAWGSLPQARAALEVLLAVACSAATGRPMALDGAREALEP